ncbi:MAG: outer membrane beta-barrel domain-containing protein [Myxococcota bacterium]
MHVLRIATFFLLTTSVAVSHAAPEPVFEVDPFEDADFGVDVQQPLVLEPAHSARGRLEFGAMFSSSVIDKYHSHLGLLFDLTYHPLRTFGISLAFGLNNGSTSGITEVALEEKLQRCRDDDLIGSACDLRLNLPDFEQLTGSADLRLVWTPLYGKINVVSEVDANLEFYTFAGGGVHGQRRPTVIVDPNRPEGFRVDGEGLAEGGFFSDLQWRGTFGVGFKIFLGKYVALRTEVMGAGWLDSFQFVGQPDEQTFATYRYFLNNGVSVALP